MKKRELIDLKKKSILELEVLLSEKKTELIKTKLELSLKKVKNVHALKFKRKEIAVIKTLIREKKLMEE